MHRLTRSSPSIQMPRHKRPAVISRPKYQPSRKHPKYTGFLALYVHYLYLLGKIGQRQYPPRMTPHLRKAAIHGSCDIAGKLRYSQGSSDC